jgi:hypothetical protein
LVARDWFGLRSESARLQAFAQLGAHFFPSSLSAFYRAEKYVRALASEVLAYSRASHSELQKKRIVERLVTGFHDHHHGIVSNELVALGLPVSKFEEREEKLVWEILRRSKEHMLKAPGLKEGGQAGILYTGKSVALYQGEPVCFVVAEGEQAPPIRPTSQARSWHIKHL